MTEKESQVTRTGKEIAVIGMSARFPGAGNINEFWNNLLKGVESISFFSYKELKETGVDPQLISHLDYIKAQGLLEDKEYFDAAFFGYTPLEAEIMNPQTRIFHECAWMALEDAGYDPERYEGLIGLYAGAASSSIWEALAYFSGKSNELGGYAALQLSDKDFISTRVSYNLNLQGPVFSAQTACSTSLVAIHLACRGLLIGECKMALAGGISLISSLKQGYLFKEGMIFSPDGHCRAFDAKAKGTIGGDGAGLVVLKRLKTAMTDGDHIYAVIKGSAINNDGKRKVGFQAPSVEAQAEVIQTAQRIAGVAPETVSYIETHGTGTTLGDPVEIEALKVAFETTKRGGCAIGSVKSNIGHVDAAAGVAGLIKTALALKYKLIPPTLHYENPNPKIDFENSPFFVNTTLRRWTPKHGPLRAGVSSFGIGGTNAHAILEEAPEVENREMASSFSRAHQLILLSAQTGSALEKITKNLVEYLKNPGINLADVAYTLQIGRRAFNHRRMFICSTVEEAINALSSNDSRKTHVFLAKNPPDVIFMFSGLGSQYVNMGLELYQTESVFREEVNRCFKILESLLEINIKNILYPNERSGGSELSPGINRVDIAQLVIFIFEYALARLVMTWGIKPDAMIGYSYGEYIAACIAGVFSLEDALKLVVIRGQLIKKLPIGAMMSVPLPNNELLPLISKMDGLSIAVDNGPSCIISGPHEAIDALEKQMKEKKYLCIRLQASHALHSKMMEPIADELEKKVKEITLNEPQIPYISNVTGNWITSREAANPGYWRRHLLGTVQFADGIKELIKEKNAIFLEIGPGRDLSAFMVRYLNNNPTQHTVNLIRPPEKNVSDIYYLLQKMGQLWLWGVNICWDKIYSKENRYRIPLPIYPFEGQRYWVEGDITSLIGAKKTLEIREGDMADWFYIPSWKRSLLIPRENKKERQGKHNWLVFLDEKGLGLMVANRLKEAGHTVITVECGSELKRLGMEAFSINPFHSEDYDHLFDELSLLKAIPDRVIHFWGITMESREKQGRNLHSKFEYFNRALYMGFYSLLYMAKAIGKQEQEAPKKIEINVVTNNMQQVSQEVVLPEKAPLLGLVKVIPQEQPGVICRSIDIILWDAGSRQKETTINQLWDELFSKSLDSAVAIRGDHRWVQTFERVRFPGVTRESLPLNEEGVYLITGGLGNIGLKIAEYLAEDFRAKLILTGRSQFPPREEWENWLSNRSEENRITGKIKKVKELEKLGAEVMIVRADAANHEQMKKVICQAETLFGKINGVIHAAGVTSGESTGPISELDESRCREQFQPKCHGLFTLEEILKDEELDFCLLTSSLSPILGGLGLAAYAASNAFMDAFVQNIKQKSPVNWISINWADWKFYEYEDQNNPVGKTGFALAMTPEEGIKTFQRILCHCKINQVVVSTWDLQARIDKWVKLKSLRDEEQIKEEYLPTLNSRPILMNPYVAPCSPLEQNLADIWQRLLGFENIGTSDDFFELGGDSLKGIIINSRIFKELKVKIPLKIFYLNPTIKSLANYISGIETSEFYAIEPCEKKEYYPSSLTQKRFYILQNLDPGNISYNIPLMLLMEGKLEKDKLEDTFKKLIKRHESLRTSFELIDGEVVQKVHHNAALAIEFFEAPKEKVKQIISKFVRLFNLHKVPLFRTALIKIGTDRHMLFIDMHHIITDGISSVVLSQEFVAFYEGKDLTLPRIKYTDFSEWQSSKRERERIRKQGEFWVKQFGDQVPVLRLRTDYPRPAVQGFTGSEINFEIGAEETNTLYSLLLEEGVSLFVALFSIYILLLWKLTGQVDLVIGTGVIGRSHPDLMNIIGLFFNTIPLRNQIMEKRSFREFLRDVKEKSLEAFEYQEYPVDMLVEDLLKRELLTRDPSRNSLFDTMFALQNFGVRTEAIPETQLAGLTIKPYQFEKQTSRFDLFFEATQRQDTIYMRVEYSTALFKPSTVQKMADNYLEILNQVLEDISIKPENITISSNLVQVKSTVEQKEYMNFGF